MKKLITVLLTLVVCVSLVATKEKKIDYVLTTVEVRDISEQIEAVGTVGYEQIYAVTTSVTGTISRVFVQEGDKVVEGQAIAEVELLPENAGSLLSTMQNVDMTQAELQEEAMKMCTIKALADGTVLSLPIYKGMQVAPTVALGSISSKDMTVTALIPESSKEDVAVGQEVTVLRNERTYTATITKIEPSTQVASQYMVTLTSSGIRLLSAGMKVDVRIVLSQCEAPSVPLQAIQSDGTLICRTQEGTVAVAVQTGLCNENYAQLLEGPPVGTSIVIGEG